MKVRSEFLSQVQSYLDGKLDLKSFREWQLSLLLDREKFDAADQEFLFAVEGRFSGMLSDVSEELFKESLKSLLPRYVLVFPASMIVTRFPSSEETGSSSGAPALNYDPDESKLARA